MALVVADPAAAVAKPVAQPLRGLAGFAFAIGSGDLDDDVTARLAPYDLVVLDGAEARRSQVRALRRRHKVMLAYLSVGTIEPGRSWYRRAKPTGCGTASRSSASTTPRPRGAATGG